MDRTLKITAIFWALSMVLVLVSSAFGSEDQYAKYIMAEVIKKAVANEKLKTERLEFEKVHKVYDLDNGDQLKKEEIFHVARLGNQLVEQLISKNGKIQKNKPRKRGMDFSVVLSERFEFSMDGNSPILENGRYYHVIHFTPKRDLKNRNNEDEVINRLTGTIYVDVITLNVSRITASMASDFRKKIIFSMHMFEMELRQAEIDNILVPQSIDVKIRYSVVGLETAERHTYEYRNFVIK